MSSNTIPSTQISSVDNNDDDDTSVNDSTCKNGSEKDVEAGSAAASEQDPSIINESTVKSYGEKDVVKPESAIAPQDASSVHESTRVNDSEKDAEAVSAITEQDDDTPINESTFKHDSDKVVEAAAAENDPSSVNDSTCKNGSDKDAATAGSAAAVEQDDNARVNESTYKMDNDKNEAAAAVPQDSSSLQQQPESSSLPSNENTIASMTTSPDDKDSTVQHKMDITTMSIPKKSDTQRCHSNQSNTENDTSIEHNILPPTNEESVAATGGLEEKVTIESEFQDAEEHEEKLNLSDLENAERLYFSDGASFCDYDSDKIKEEQEAAAAADGDDSFDDHDHDLFSEQEEDEDDDHEDDALFNEDPPPNADDFSSQDDVDEEEDEDEEDMSVSLNDIKQKVMGRDIIQSNDDDDSYNKKPNSRKSKSEVRREVSCAICHDVLYNPISLNCGHSFCEGCVTWWIDYSRRSSQQNRQDSLLSTDVGDDEYGNCPTCRQELNCDVKTLGINTSLRECVSYLFHEEVQCRIVAAKRAMSGENGGAHSRGYEIINKVTEESYKKLRNAPHVASNQRLLAAARRSIVMDAQDQRMQLALALRSDICVENSFHGDDEVMVVSLCVLTMEEDEASDGVGFPLVVRDEDDEHLICMDDARFHSCVEVIASVGSDENDDGDGAVSEVPIARRGIGDDGVVQFHIDAGMEELKKATSLCFRHDETGAEFQIRLSDKQRVTTDDDEEEDDSVMQNEQEYESNHDDDEDLDEFEDDGFLVSDQHEEDEDEIFSEESDVEDEDVCCLCKESGLLIVCDGGDNLEGCSRSFHIDCVNRNVIPPGDWVCESCARAYGLDVGIEGHEFTVSNEDKQGDDEDDEEEEDDVLVVAPSQKNRLKRHRNHALTDDDSDDDDEFEVNENIESKEEIAQDDESNHEESDIDQPPKKKTSNRNVIEDDDDDSDHEELDASDIDMDENDVSEDKDKDEDLQQNDKMKSNRKRMLEESDSGNEEVEASGDANEGYDDATDMDQDGVSEENHNTQATEQNDKVNPSRKRSLEEIDSDKEELEGNCDINEADCAAANASIEESKTNNQDHDSKLNNEENDVTPPQKDEPEEHQAKSHEEQDSDKLESKPDNAEAKTQNDNGIDETEEQPPPQKKAKRRCIIDSDDDDDDEDE